MTSCKACYLQLLRVYDLSCRSCLPLFSHIIPLVCPFLLALYRKAPDGSGFLSQADRMQQHTYQWPRPLYPTRFVGNLTLCLVCCRYKNRHAAEGVGYRGLGMYGTTHHTNQCRICGVRVIQTRWLAVAHYLVLDNMQIPKDPGT